MGDPVGQQGMETRIGGNDFKPAGCGRVPVKNRLKILRDALLNMHATASLSTGDHHSALDPLDQTYGLSGHGFFSPHRIQSFAALHLDIHQSGST